MGDSKQSRGTDMRNLVTNITAGIILLITGYIASRLKSHPVLAVMLISLVFMCLVIWFLYCRYYQSIYKIRKGISIIAGKLISKSKRPDLIIAFNRNGAIAAGMLACNLREAQDKNQKGPQVIVLNRCLNEGSRSGRYRVGSLIESLNTEQINDMQVLITVIVTSADDTLKAGLHFLEEQGIQVKNKMDQGSLHFASIYITPTVLERLQDELGKSTLIYAYETPRARQALDKIPWLLDRPYPHD